MNSTRILVVDDQFSDRELVKDILEREDFIIDTAETGKDAIEKLNKQQYEIVLTDLMMPEIDGLQLLKIIKANNFDTEIILMTAYATVQTAIEAIKLGAYDYLIKPLNKPKTIITLKNCTEAHKRKKELKSLREKVANMERMSAIAAFASGIAHQMRNPLFAISTTAEYLIEKYKDDKELLESLNLIARNSRQADKIIFDLLRTNYTDVKLEKVPLNEVILETVKSVEVELKEKNFSLTTELSKVELYVLANYSYLQQCFLNLITNSVDAVIPGKLGEINIKTSIFEDKVTQSKNFVCVEFKDNGKGIPEKFLSKVFEPFFTLKPEGTGMGLFFVYQFIVNCCGGDIRLESIEGKGTKVTILLCRE